jgi:hypothetical protein
VWTSVVVNVEVAEVVFEQRGRALAVSRRGERFSRLNARLHGAGISQTQGGV